MKAKTENQHFNPLLCQRPVRLAWCAHVKTARAEKISLMLIT
jgi:hypothetical protein